MASPVETRDGVATTTMDVLSMTTAISILTQEMAAIITSDPVRWRALQREVLDVRRQRVALEALLKRR